jgi:hypothetical protein
MDNATLVEADVSTGTKALKALDDAGLRVKVALWMSSPSYYDWKFVIASPELDQEDLLKAYERVVVRLQSAFKHELPPILILRMKDPLIRELRQVFSKTESVEGMRLGGQSIGDTFLHNAYVYRIK